MITFSIFGIMGWVLAIFSVGFVSGSIVAYRRVHRQMLRANEVMAANVATQNMLDAMRDEQES